MMTPKAVKLFDIQDIALSLATLNSNADARANSSMWAWAGRRISRARM